MRKYSHIVLFCPNPKLGEPYFTAVNPKKECQIEGGFDINKPLEYSDRIVEQKVTFGNDIFYCMVFARIESGMRVEEMNDKMNGPEMKYCNIQGSTLERYMNTVISFAPRMLCGYSYDDLTKKSKKEKASELLPDARISGEYKTLSTEAEEDLHVKQMKRMKKLVSTTVL